MKLALEFLIPAEKGNITAKDGTLVQAINDLAKEADAEAVYLYVKDGKRGGMMIYDESDSARMPVINEPFFQAVDAEISITPVTKLEDLMKVI